jgi:predicted double-glycine peptidase
LDTSTVFGTLPTTSWKARRDQGIVKRGFDYSCGAVALATILHLYGNQATELQLLQAMDIQDGLTSFEEMAKVLPSLGFKAQGLAVSFEQLSQLQVPVIAYLHLEGKTHFTLLLSTSEDFVWLGDPFWGNHLLSKTHFLTLWKTQSSPTEGKILVVLPMDNKEPEREGLRMPASDALAIQWVVGRWME